MTQGAPPVIPTEPRLTVKEKLAMFRCALYTSMGVRNDEQKPSDRQCLGWLQLVYGQAEHRNDPPIKLIAHPPVSVKTQSIKSDITIVTWDAVIELPEWRNLPR